MVGPHLSYTPSLLLAPHKLPDLIYGEGQGLGGGGEGSDFFLPHFQRVGWHSIVRQAQEPPGYLTTNYVI